jgi:D-3-phosphoglycerate dehydrogenase
MNKYFIFDFDSTFMQVEALDVLCEIVHKNNPNVKDILSEIQRITDLGMAGEMSLKASLIARIKLLNATRDDLEKLIAELSHKVSPSILRNAHFFKQFSEKIYIISNGFKEVIIPVVQKYGIKAEHVLANSFVFDQNGSIIGFDETEELCENKGKALKIESLNLNGEVIMIGDGYTDYETKKYGVVHEFYAFTENVKRQLVIDEAEKIARSLDSDKIDMRDESDNQDFDFEAEAQND